MNTYLHKIAVLFVLIFITAKDIASAQQTSIDNGLFYLYSTQNPDGSWGGTGTS